MRPIPSKDKEILAGMKQICAKCGANKVEWHHPFTYRGRQITNWWATIFACKVCHDRATPHKNQYQQEIREFFERKVIEKYLMFLVVNYPKRDWTQLWQYLNKQRIK